MADDVIARFIRSKEWAFRALFKGQDGQLNEAAKIALADLRTFCHGTQSNFSKNALEMARMEGRREVFTRVMAFLEVDYSKFYQLEEPIDD